MTSKKALNTTNLEALGAQQLAELLIELSHGNAVIQRRIRLALAGAHSSEAVAKEVRKRLTTLHRSRTFVDWQNRNALIAELESQRLAIVNKVAKADLSEAIELLWRFLALANSILERCDDNSGAIIGVFHIACEDLGEIAPGAKIPPDRLAEWTFNALNENDYGQYDGLIKVLSAALGPIGIEQLKARFTDLAKNPPERPKDKDRRIIGWGTGGPLYADEMASRRRESIIRLALQEIADAQDDVDGFIAQHGAKRTASPEDFASESAGHCASDRNSNAEEPHSQSRSGTLHPVCPRCGEVDG